MTNRTATLLLLPILLLTQYAGSARAQNDHAVVRDSEGQIVHNSFGTCVRTQWSSDRDACQTQQMVQQITEEKQEVRTAQSLTQKERTVFFRFNSSVLSPESTQRLDTLAQVLKSNQSVKEARIVGFADRFGTISYNQQLSQKRAMAVRDYLIANGYTNARVTETRWVGKSEPTANCSKTKSRKDQIECLQNDRRVEVEIGYNQQTSAR
jgi:outer membrane protein OmpA-like peptidoglycan-associated protein